MKTQTVFAFVVMAVSPYLAAADSGPLAGAARADSGRAIYHEYLSPDAVWNGPETVVRGQDPTFDNGSGSSPFYDGAPYSPTSPAMPYSYTQPTQPMMVDPFMNPQALQAQPQIMPGVNGPQPFKYGWTLRTEMEYLAGEAVSGPGAGGDLEIWGLDFEAENITPLSGGWVFIHSPEFGWRGLEGPTSVNAAGNGLPGSVFHLGWDLKWQTPNMGGWSAEFAFEPQINTDFSNVGSDAWMFDGKAGLYWQWDPTFTLVGGVMYWDRVKDQVLPYGGVIWNPNQLWEFRIMYPETQLKFFLGTFMNEAKWFYTRVEYHNEAYEVELDGGISPIASQAEFEDWRVALGLQSDNGYMSSFIEAGWVFDRTVRLKGVNTLDLDTGFMARAGFRF